MKVLIACEFSGIVRNAFIERGHDAVSCDIETSEKPGAHIIGNVLDLLDDGWDMMIAHPPCTYLCNSGVRWLHEIPGRWELMRSASKFFYEFVESSIHKICIENPIPHKYGKLPKYSQIIQPWLFGHNETKATCLWLKNLPKLKPTNIVSGRQQKIHCEPPGKNRSRNRSRTYKGIAKGMAEQWG
ncbi:MAG: DNA cytosine methyltransferase [Candidatus Marinimicrobia bacterium]|nr:DNA cytosine methyltransferase [Candidatus Neomarinimicrobiota bacterium]